MIANQCDGRASTEIDVGFIDNNHGLGIAVEQLLDRTEIQRDTGWRVRVGNDNATIAGLIIIYVDVKSSVERNGLEFDLVKRAIDRVKAVTDIGKQNR